MFERFTDRARKVFAFGNQEAQRYNHEYIGTEHILLGLVKEGSGKAVIVLENRGVNLPRVRTELEKTMHKGSDLYTLSKLPQTPRVKRVIELATIEAANRNHSLVGTEHLLVGLIEEQEGLGAKALAAFGLDGSTLPALREDLYTPADRSEEVSADELERERMYERLSWALHEACAAGFQYPHAQHLLLAALREPQSIAVQALSDLGLDSAMLATLRRELSAPANRSWEASGDSAELTPLAQAIDCRRMEKLFSWAKEEAESAGFKYPHAQHLLLAVFREPSSLALQALTRLGIDEAKLRARIKELTEAPPAAGLP